MPEETSKSMQNIKPGIRRWEFLIQLSYKPLPLSMLKSLDFFVAILSYFLTYSYSYYLSQSGESNGVHI